MKKITLYLLLIVVPVVARANLITNGSFESGPAIPGGQSYLTLSGGSTAITGWTVTGTTVDYIGPGWNVSNGIRAVDLDGAFSTGGIQQTFATIAGDTYVVSFDLSGNPGAPGQAAGPVVKDVQVSVDAFLQDYQFDTTGLTMSTLTWAPTSFSFTASGTSATLSFLSQSPAGNSWGALIDNVSVVAALNPIPEPASLGLFGLGLTAIYFSRRRKTV